MRSSPVNWLGFQGDISAISGCKTATTSAQCAHGLLLPLHFNTMTIGGCRKNERCGELAGRIGKQQQTQQQTAVRATDVCATHFPPNITANNCCLVVSLAIGTFTKFFSHFNFDALEKLKAKSESTNWPFVCACVSAGYLPSYFVCSFARSFVWLVDRSVAFLISISCKSVYFSVRRSSPDVPRKNHHTRARTHPHKYKNGPICWATLPGKCFFCCLLSGFWRCGQLFQNKSLGVTSWLRSSATK